MPSCGHAEMVDAKLRQLGELVDMRFERGCVGVDFGVPARDRVDAGSPAPRYRRRLSIRPRRMLKRTATHAHRIELDDFGIRIVVRGSASRRPSRAELRQHVPPDSSGHWPGTRPDTTAPATTPSGFTCAR